MKMIPVSARGLHRRTIRANDTVLDDATIFPFFDRDGNVSSLMVTAQGAWDIWLVPWTEELVSAPLFGTIRLRTNLSLHCAAWAGDAGTSAGNWHYDPWWLLAVDKFSDRRELVAVLKATNAVNRMVDVQQLWFSRDLSRVRFAVTNRESTFALSRWNPRFLIASKPSRLVRTRSSAGQRSQAIWQYDPIGSYWQKEA